MHKFLIALVLAVVSSVAACRNIPVVRSVRPDVDTTPVHNLVSTAAACSILTLAEAEAAFNQTFVIPVGSDGKISYCQYFNTNGFGLTIEVSRASTISDDYEKLKADLLNGGKDLSGVGDKAFEYMNARRQIVFIKGTALVTMYSASRIDPDIFRALVKLVASRI